MEFPLYCRQAIELTEGTRYVYENGIVKWTGRVAIRVSRSSDQVLVHSKDLIYNVITILPSGITGTSTYWVTASNLFKLIDNQ